MEIDLALLWTIHRRCLEVMVKGVAGQQNTRGVVDFACALAGIQYDPFMVMICSVKKSFVVAQLMLGQFSENAKLSFGKDIVNATS